MTQPGDQQWLTWYQQFDETHGPAERKNWYSDSSTAYRWARPRYPQSLIDRVFEQAHLNAQSSLLEIGCGPGIATESLAAKGLSIIGIEPSAAACNLARKSCQNNEKVTIINSTFEQYDLDQQKYDAVLAATCFHWISPDVACAKSAAALKPHGSLILLWATPPQPSAELSDYLQPVYDRHNLTTLSEGQKRTGSYYQSSFESFAETINDSGLFSPSHVEISTHHSTYSIEKYLALLTTLSPYIEIEEQIRENLLIELGERLSEKLDSGALNTTHWFASQVAPLKRDT